MRVNHNWELNTCTRCGWQKSVNPKFKGWYYKKLDGSTVYTKQPTFCFDSKLSVETSKELGTAV